MNVDRKLLMKEDELLKKAVEVAIKGKPADAQSQAQTPASGSETLGPLNIPKPK